MSEPPEDSPPPADEAVKGEIVDFELKDGAEGPESGPETGDSSPVKAQNGSELTANEPVRGEILAPSRQVYAPPGEFDGSPEEFSALIAALRPIHCGYPDGARLDPRSGLPCRRKREKHGTCSLHAETRLPEVLSDVSPTMRKRLQNFFGDVFLTDSRSNVAVSEYVLHERLAMVDSGESVAFIEMIEQAVARIRRELRSLNRAIEGDYKEDEDAVTRMFFDLAQASKTIDSALNSLDVGSSIRKRKHHSLEALSKANLESLKNKEVTAKIVAHEQAVVSRQHAAAMAAEVIDIYMQAVDRYVADPMVRDQMSNFIHAQSQALMSRANQG